MAIEKEVRNIEYQTKELCPLAEFCFINYEKSKKCLGRENYMHCGLLQYGINVEEKYLREGLQEKILSWKKLEEAREQLDMGRLRYHEDLAKEKEKKAEEKAKSQKSMPLLREKSINF